MAEVPSAADLARDIAGVLETDQMPYAIGGAVALGFYTAPRGTRDLDVNVLVPPRKDSPGCCARSSASARAGRSRRPSGVQRSKKDSFAGWSAECVSTS